MRRHWASPCRYLGRARRGAVRTQSPLPTICASYGCGMALTSRWHGRNDLQKLPPPHLLSPELPWGGRGRGICRSPGSRRGDLGTGSSGPLGGRAWRRGPGGKRTLAVCKRSHGRRGQAAPPRRIHDDSPATAPLWPYALPLPTQALPAKPGQPESAGSRPGMVGVRD